MTVVIMNLLREIKIFQTRWVSRVSRVVNLEEIFFMSDKSKQLFCSRCGKPRKAGKTICNDCYLRAKRERYNAQEVENICKVCNKPFMAHANQVNCPSCKKEKTTPTDGFICSECGGPRKPGRGQCRPCYLKSVRDRYVINGRWETENRCKACDKLFITHRSKVKFCPECKALRLEVTKHEPVTNRYEPSVDKRYAWEHRRLAEEILDRKLKRSEVLHHIDGDPKNNDLSNLIVLLRKYHIALHTFLDDMKLIFENIKTPETENCWPIVLVMMTQVWIDVKDVKVWQLKKEADFRERGIRRRA
jgi:Zn finger protein HypA/HybF involved in hydrogenase expression